MLANENLHENKNYAVSSFVYPQPLFIGVEIFIQGRKSTKDLTCPGTQHVAATDENVKGIWKLLYAQIVLVRELSDFEYQRGNY